MSGEKKYIDFAAAKKTHCDICKETYVCYRNNICGETTEECKELQAFDRIPAADVVERPQWVSVKERLPDERINPNTHDFEYVLCATIWGDVRPFKYGTPIGHTEAHFWNGLGYVDAYITHWMPLPEPPKMNGGADR